MAYGTLEEKEINTIRARAKIRFMYEMEGTMGWAYSHRQKTMLSVAKFIQENGHPRRGYKITIMVFSETSKGIALRVDFDHVAISNLYLKCLYDELFEIIEMDV